MNFQVTIRHGRTTQRYLTLEVQAPDAAAALRAVADMIPEDVSPHADLVELRIAPDPDDRTREMGSSGP